MQRREEIKTFIIHEEGDNFLFAKLYRIGNSVIFGPKNGFQCVAM